MIYTTLNRIRAQSPRSSGWTKLLRGLSKTAADDEPLGFDAILRINGADDALWCLRAEPQHDRLWRMVAVRCARTVQHLMTDPCSLAALDVAERHAHGDATDTELAAAWDGCRKRTYGQRRAFIGDTLANGLDGYRRGGNTSVEDREQLRRYFDALCGIEPDPDDSTYDKYDYLTVALDPPPPNPLPRKATPSWTRTSLRCYALTPRP